MIGGKRLYKHVCYEINVLLNIQFTNSLYHENKFNISALSYISHENYLQSDHKPVSGIYEILLY